MSAQEILLLATLYVDPSWPIFTNHFPGNPIWPAFKQLEWVRKVFEDHTKFTIKEFVAVKFLKPIVPEQNLNFEIQQRLEFYEFLISSELGIATKGRLILIS